MGTLLALANFLRPGRADAVTTVYDAVNIVARCTTGGSRLFARIIRPDGSLFFVTPNPGALCNGLTVDSLVASSVTIPERNYSALLTASMTEGTILVGASLRGFSAP